MSLFPVDLERYKTWTIRQLYYFLFPYIKKDFMGKKDCSSIHTEGNMQVTTSPSGGTFPVIHVAVRGGSDNILSAKEAEYRTRAEEGEVTISAAQETGQFAGR